MHSNAGNEDYVQPNSILFLAGDAVNTTRRLQLTVRDDQQVEGPETFHLVISDDFNPMHPVTTSGRGVVAVTVLDDDSEYYLHCAFERRYNNVV